MGLLACPCHLPITLPLILGVFGSGALGAFLARNTIIFYALFSAWFVGGLYVGYVLLQRWGKKQDGAACDVNPPLPIRERSEDHA